jgi:hypothetical protein
LELLDPPDFNSFTQSAYLKVLNVVSVEVIEGEMFPIITVKQLPINESLSTMVNLLPLNGRCYLAESKALIHSLSASNDLFISAPSYHVYLLVSFTSLPLSFPAKSIKLI